VQDLRGCAPDAARASVYVESARAVRFGSEAEVAGYRVLATVSTSEMVQPRPAPTLN